MFWLGLGIGLAIGVPLGVAALVVGLVVLDRLDRRDREHGNDWSLP